MTRRNMNVIDTGFRRALQAYAVRWPQESATVALFADLLGDAGDPFRRERLAGHFTASCWLVDRDGGRVLLTHHKKVGLWLQLGGHADGERDLRIAALKEAEEESGLRELRIEAARLIRTRVDAIGPLFKKCIEHPLERPIADHEGSAGPAAPAGPTPKLEQLLVALKQAIATIHSAASHAWATHASQVTLTLGNTEATEAREAEKVAENAPKTTLDHATLDATIDHAPRDI